MSIEFGSLILKRLDPHPLAGLSRSNRVKDSNNIEMDGMQTRLWIGIV